MNNDINDVLGIDNSSEQIEGSKKYFALRTIAGVISFIAWAVAILSVIVSGYILFKSNESGTVLIPLVIFVVGLISFISLLSWSETIKVFIDIEANTRKSAMK
jgi:hypothetical protein